MSSRQVFSGGLPSGHTKKEKMSGGAAEDIFIERNLAFSQTGSDGERGGIIETKQPLGRKQSGRTSRGDKRRKRF